jgi:cell division protein FtsI/penicillin-binding protein 2
MSIIANKGIYRKPAIIKDETYNPVLMDINSTSFDTVWNGMNAVVNETGGTAEGIFASANFPEKDVKVYGKTGSTEAPINGWFAGFANDSQNRSIAFAVLVEGSEHGAIDAGPIAREAIKMCIDADYIGKANHQKQTE